MTSHFFNHPLVKLHYYRFGKGPKAMLCFHGYGMHGKQFSVLTEKLGDEYTFYGFDLFFHKETILQDQSLGQIKRGISKAEFSALIESFCNYESIDRYSVIGYSLGTHYASVLAEQEPSKIDQLFILAPSFLKIFRPFQLMARNRLANYAFRKLFLSESGIKILLSLAAKIKVIDLKSHRILSSELATPALRYAFYANVTFLRNLQVEESSLVAALNKNAIKSFFVFGERDRMYPVHLADRMIPQLNFATKITLDEDHDLVNHRLPSKLYHLIYDHQG